MCPIAAAFGKSVTSLSLLSPDTWFHSSAIICVLSYFCLEGISSSFISLLSTLSLNKKKKNQQQ
jgi:hypothetical protein